GAAAGRGSWIAFMDSDCFAAPGWLRNSIAAIEDGVGLVQGKTLPDPEGKPGVFTWCPETLSENVVYECTNILYRREAFEQAGGFPADLTPDNTRPLGGEDMMMGWGVKRLGWRSNFAPQSIVYHEVAPMPKWLWFADFRLLLWPEVVARFPEMRSRLYGRYFWDRAQALLTLAFLGAGLAFVSPWFLALAGPYLYLRCSPRSKSFPGPLRPLRAVPWIVRDTAFMIILLVGSVRARALLI
ncbi:MAG TPA: hypothetical protein DEH78_03430, partial [Solibacterales bacterium]|nr:hypothetical protein [Bryobacterales bacterium]